MSVGDVHRDSMILVVDPDASVKGSRSVIGPFPGSEYQAFSVGQSEDGRQQVAYGPAPFGRSTSLGLADSVVYVGEGSAWRILRSGLDGGVQAIIRRSGSARPVDEAVVDSAIAAGFERVSDEDARRRIRRKWAESTLPDSLPVTSTLLVDADGNLWVREDDFRLPWVGSRMWSVFDSAGVWLGRVQTPRGLWVRSVLSDAVIGVYFDELGIEYVRRYPIVKSGAE